MTGARTHAVVRMAAGDWVLARSETALLFASPAAAPLVDSFIAARSVSGVVDAVTEAFEAGAASSPDAAFAIVDWHAGTRVVVHGDVTLITDHASLPRLSAAGVGTWIERRLRWGGQPITIGVEPDRVDPLTAVGPGVVRAGAFAIEMPSSAATPDVGETAAPVASNDSARVQNAPSHSGTAGRTDPGSAGSPRSPLDALAAAAESSVEPVDAPMVEPDQAAGPATDTHSQPTVPDATGADVDERPAGSPPADPQLLLDAPPRLASPEPSSVPTLGAGLPPAPPRRSAAPISETDLIDAVVCPSCGAPNSIDADECRRCGGTWPSDTPTEQVPRPVWRLVSDDEEYVIDHHVVIGREPDDNAPHWPAGAAPLTIDSAYLSGEHLEVRPADWVLQVTDLDSSNGSFIITSGDHQRAKIEPFAPHRVGHGAWIQIGDQNFRVEHGDGPPSDAIER